MFYSGRCLAFLLCLSIGFAGPVGLAQEKEDLRQAALELVQETGTPGFGLRLSVDGKLIENLAIGERSIGSEVAVEGSDKWHLGSISKSITSTAVARLAEKGLISWDLTVSEALGEAVEDLHPDFSDVSLRLLLSHRSGLAANISPFQLISYPLAPTDARANRIDYAGKMLKRAPKAPPGEKNIYSNAGYIVAAAMLENVLDKSWEDIVEAEVFEPLSLESAGFGPAGNADEIDQPFGHRRKIFGKGSVAMKPGESGSDNPAVMRSAGGVHMSLEDLTDYATAHISGKAPDGSVYLTEDSLTLLHTPHLDRYAMGWVIFSSETRPTTIWHNGSNTLNYAELWIIPETRTVLAMAANNHNIAELMDAFQRLAAKALQYD